MAILSTLVISLMEAVMIVYRLIRTTQERRANGRRCLLKIDEYVVKLRPSRNYSNLPNSWDDINRCCMRSWKKHRKTQYK